MAVVVPEYITVHLGRPEADARNVRVRFVDYIKNVASSEIYPTWPENAIRANILAEITFALNRVYTEYYRSRGYDFDITNSIAFDQSFNYGRDIFLDISKITDDIFNDYIIREGYVEPIFAAYCDGREVTCQGLSQWGSVERANEGMTPFEILQYYYGNDIGIVFNAPVEGVEESYPGVPLRLGSSGEEVRQLQYRLNRIAADYPSLPLIPEITAIYGVATEEAVRSFQRIFNLTPDGIVGKATWYKVLNIYNGVKSLSDLDSEGVTPTEAERQFERELDIGDTGQSVGILQYFLYQLAAFDPTLPEVRIDWIFGARTREAVEDFQERYGLPVTGVVDRETWNRIISVYDRNLQNLKDSGRSADFLFPGKFLTLGMEGDEVRALQRLINGAAKRYPEIPSVAEDGVFGAGTERAVREIRKLAGLGDKGVVGPLTWEAAYELSR